MNPYYGMCTLEGGEEAGQTPCWIDACWGRADALRVLIKAGANVNQADNYGYTPCWIAAYNGNVEALRVLIEAGADVNQADNYGRTPCFIAACDGEVDALRLLIPAGADVNQADKYGKTPCFIAACYGYTNALCMLIEAGAEWRVIHKNTIDDKVRLCIAKRKRLLLTEEAIGLHTLDLPVLCVLEICSWLLNDGFDDPPGEETVRWALCAAVKNSVK